MRSAPAVAFDYRPSRRAFFAATAVSAAAVFAPWLSALPPGASIGVSVVVLIAAAVALRRFLHPRFHRIAVHASGWKLVDASGVEHAADIDSHARAGAWLTLAFRLPDRSRFRALLGPDNTDSETRRRLGVLLIRAEIAQTG